VEVKYANDMLTLEKHDQAHQLYSGPGRLTGYLEEAGWKVEHNFPAVGIGHRAVVSRKNLDGRVSEDGHHFETRPILTARPIRPVRDKMGSRHQRPHLTKESRTHSTPVELEQVGR